MLKPIYLSGVVRTPIGTFGGSLSHLSAPALGAAAVKGAIAKAGISADHIDEVIFGNVIGAGLGQNVARQVSIGAGLSASIGATTVNKVCGSGLKAVMLAAQAIRCGDASTVIAGGTESMSRAPYLLDKARTGYRMGDGVLIDSMIRDGLWDVYNNVHMGTCGDACASKYQFSRKEQDDFAVASFNRAIAAQKNGEFADEIVAIEGVTDDENPKKFNEEKLRKLKPAFGKDGTVTAGNASSINDGAAAVVVSGEKGTAKPQAKVMGFATFAQAPEWFTTAPIGAIGELLKKLSLKVSDVDLFEINEAFSVVVMAAMKDLAIPHEKVNVNGGAVALGHPIGASGARTLVTLIHAMKKRGAKIGVVSLCLGGGEAVAMAVENV
jgi:acetyl-CoA C-acetyltransferase